MMNDEALYYDSIAELDERFFTDKGLKDVFTKLVQLGSVTADSLIRNDKTPRQQALIKTVDGERTHKNDFECSFQGIKKVSIKRQLYHTLNNTVNRVNEAEYDELAAGLGREINQ